MNTEASPPVSFLFVLPPYEPFTPLRAGALATCLEGLGTALRRRGQSAAVLAPTSNERPYSTVPVFTYRSPPRARRLLRLAGMRPANAAPRAVRRALADATRAEGCPDVVLACNSTLGFRDAKTLCPETTTVLWLQNVASDEHLREFQAHGTPDLVLANSAFTARASAAALGWPVETIRVLLNAVDVRAFSPDPHDGEPTIGRPLRVLLLGRIDPNKGFDRALSALQRASDAGVNLSVTLAGPLVSWGGDPHAHLRALQSQLDAVGGRYVGNVDRVSLPDFMRDFDVMMVPSLSEEPFGLVVLEGMATGLAVISSERGGLPEACGGAAVLVDPSDVDAMAAAIVALSEPSALRAAKQRSIDRAARRRWDDAADDLLRILPRR